MERFTEQRSYLALDHTLSHHFPLAQSPYATTQQNLVVVLNFADPISVSPFANNTYTLPSSSSRHPQRPLIRRFSTPEDLQESLTKLFKYFKFCEGDEARCKALAAKSTMDGEGLYQMSRRGLERLLEDEHKAEVLHNCLHKSSGAWETLAGAAIFGFCLIGVVTVLSWIPDSSME